MGLDAARQHCTRAFPADQDPKLRHVDDVLHGLVRSLLLLLLLPLVFPL